MRNRLQSQVMRKCASVSSSENKQSLRSKIISSVLLALLMGFLITIAIAWSLTLWHPVPLTDHSIWSNNSPSQPPPDNNDRTVFIETSDLGSFRRLSSPDHQGNWFYSKRTIQSWSILNQKPTNPNQLIIEDARGWPLLALRSTFTGVAIKPGLNWCKTSWSILTLHGGMRIKPRHKRDNDFSAYKASLALPLQPIYLNVMIDTLFWALLWFIVSYPFAFFLSIPLRLRRRHRIRRNRCPCCAYDLRGLSHRRCPECGLIVDNNIHIEKPFLKMLRSASWLIMLAVVMTIPIIVWMQWQSPWNIYEAVLYHDQSAIHAAVARGEDIDEVFVTSLEPSIGNLAMTPLEQAVDMRDDASVKTLLELGADVNVHGSLLEEAIDFRSINMDIIHQLIQAGANINQYGPSSRSPLIAAADTTMSKDITQSEMIKRSQIIQLLVNLGAKVNETDESNCTALEYVIHDCNLAAIQSIINHGADINPVNSDGELLLYKALFNPDPKIFDYLLQQPEININQKDGKGRTVLMRAVTMRPVRGNRFGVNEKTIQHLLNLGADPTAGDQSKQSILDLCATPEIKKIIQAAIDRRKHGHTSSAEEIPSK